jgi:hypothetical protein
MKSIARFLATFVLGALLALGARTALHDPHADHDTAGATTTRGDYAPMVKNSPPVPPAASSPPSHPTPAPAAPATAARPGTPVNSICALCGMKVDPTLPTMEYQGQTIGFGCKMCPPKFQADPAKYGPAYLRNELIKR